MRLPQAQPIGGFDIEPLVSSEQSEPNTIKRSDYILKGAGGSLAVTEWQPQGEAKLTLIALHGFADYGPSTFQNAAKYWAKEGIRTIAYDQRGFGRNPSRGDWPGPTALIEDAALLFDYSQAKYPQPVSIIGHSMGGAVVAAAIGEGHIAPQKAVLLGPALWGGPHLNAGYRMMAGSAALLMPNKRWTGNGVVRIQASDNIDMLRSLGRDPLYLRNPSSREFIGLIRLMDRAHHSAPDMDSDMLILYGAKEQVIPRVPVEKTAALFSKPAQFEVIETGWHLLLRDLQAEIVYERVRDFLLN